MALEQRAFPRHERSPAPLTDREPSRLAARCYVRTRSKIRKLLVLFTRCDRGPVAVRYGRPKTIDDLVNHTVGRVLDLFGIENELLKRWGEPPPSN